MKKTLALVLALVLCLTMGSVAFAADKTIAGVVFQEDQFMKMLADGYAAAAKDLGYEIMQSNTNNDQSKESEILNTYVAQGIAGVAISPLNSDTSAATLKDASDAGLAIAVCNTHFDSFPYAVANFSADNYTFCNQTGAAAVEFIKANYPADQVIKLGIVQFKTQIPEQSADRVNGFLGALDDAGVKYEIVSDQDAWLQDMAVAKAGDMLSANPEINIIYAANDGGTVGSTMAVDNAGLAGKVFVFGTDGSEQIVGLLKDDNNILQAVTAQDPYQIGYNTAAALINKIEGNPVEGEGKDNIIAGIPLNRNDVAGLDAFLGK
ncbi:MAG: substrate-binding domain-containing protein [Clostridia bacterium]